MHFTSMQEFGRSGKGQWIYSVQTPPYIPSGYCRNSFAIKACEVIAINLFDQTASSYIFFNKITHIPLVKCHNWEVVLNGFLFFLQKNKV